MPTATTSRLSAAAHLLQRLDELREALACEKGGNEEERLSALFLALALCGDPSLPPPVRKAAERCVSEGVAGGGGDAAARTQPFLRCPQAFEPGAFHPCPPVRKAACEGAICVAPTISNPCP